MEAMELNLDLDIEIVKQVNFSALNFGLLDELFVFVQFLNFIFLSFIEL